MLWCVLEVIAAALQLLTCLFHAREELDRSPSRGLPEPECLIGLVVIGIFVVFVTTVALLAR